MKTLQLRDSVGFAPIFPYRSVVADPNPKVGFGNGVPMTGNILASNLFSRSWQFLIRHTILDWGLQIGLCEGAIDRAHRWL